MLAKTPTQILVDFGCKVNKTGTVSDAYIATALAELRKRVDTVKFHEVVDCEEEAWNAALDKMKEGLR